MGFMRELRWMKAERDWEEALRRAESGERLRVEPETEGESVKIEPPPVFIRGPQISQ